MHAGTGLLTRAPAFCRLPVPFPDQKTQWVIHGSQALPTHLILDGGAVANAHTVAGQWRLFTAFPYIPGVFAMGRCEQTACARGDDKLLFPSVYRAGVTTCRTLSSLCQLLGNRLAERRLDITGMKRRHCLDQRQPALFLCDRIM